MMKRHRAVEVLCNVGNANCVAALIKTNTTCLCTKMVSVLPYAMLLTISSSVLKRNKYVKGKTNQPWVFQCSAAKSVRLTPVESVFLEEIFWPVLLASLGNFHKCRSK